MISQERLGTSRNVINRVLQDLKAKNLIRLSRGKITLAR
ncbi:helix-turn-helix domain-containing protein [uncultured Campylobacter sp.]